MFCTAKLSTLCGFTKGVSVDVLYLKINDVLEYNPTLCEIRVQWYKRTSIPYQAYLVDKTSKCITRWYLRVCLHVRRLLWKVLWCLGRKALPRVCEMRNDGDFGFFFPSNAQSTIRLNRIALPDDEIENGFANNDRTRETESWKTMEPKRFLTGCMSSHPTQKVLSQFDSVDRDSKSGCVLFKNIIIFSCSNS